MVQIKQNQRLLLRGGMHQQDKVYYRCSVAKNSIEQIIYLANFHYGSGTITILIQLILDYFFPKDGLLKS